MFALLHHLSEGSGEPQAEKASGPWLVSSQGQQQGTVYHLHRYIAYALFL